MENKHARLDIYGANIGSHRVLPARYVWRLYSWPTAAVRVPSGADFTVWAPVVNVGSDMTRSPRRCWMICDVIDRHETPCLFDEETVIYNIKSDPPRCIRHGALLFSDTTLDGMTRQQAKARLLQE